MWRKHLISSLYLIVSFRRCNTEGLSAQRDAFFCISLNSCEKRSIWAIRDIFREKGYAHLDVLMHYPLRHLVTSASNLPPEQRTYASRSWTHLDFLIYDTVSHRAKLAIEVDGTQFHRRGSNQGQRDQLKDSILEAIGLPLLRLSTTGSQEKVKIVQALSKADSLKES